MESIGKRIKFAREKKNYSLRVLAKLTGKTHQLLHQYEKGLRNPKEENIKIIASALNVDPLWLTYGSLSYVENKAGKTVICNLTEDDINEKNKLLNSKTNKEKESDNYELLKEDIEFKIHFCDKDTLYMVSKIIDSLGNIDENKDKYIKESMKYNCIK